MATDYFKEIIGKNFTLLIMHNNEKGNFEMLDVKAVLLKPNGIRKRIGYASMGIKDEEKRAELCNIYIEPYFRHREIGGKMLRLMVDFYKDDKAQEIFGDITASKVPKKAKNFYAKNNFSIIEKESQEGKNIKIKLILKKTQDPQFYYLHKIEPITKNEYFSI